MVKPDTRSWDCLATRALSFQNTLILHPKIAIPLQMLPRLCSSILSNGYLQLFHRLFHSRLTTRHKAFSNKLGIIPPSERLIKILKTSFCRANSNRVRTLLFSFPRKYKYQSKNWFQNFGLDKICKHCFKVVFEAVFWGELPATVLKHSKLWGTCWNVPIYGK